MEGVIHRLTAEFGSLQARGMEKVILEDEGALSLLCKGFGLASPVFDDLCLVLGLLTGMEVVLHLELPGMHIVLEPDHRCLFFKLSDKVYFFDVSSSRRPSSASSRIC